MNRDLIERALRQPGPREDGYLPVALPASAADAPRAHGWRGMLLAAGQVGALTAAVVAGAAIAVMLSRGNAPAPGTNGTGAGSPTPSPVPSLAVPSANPSLAAPSTRDCRHVDFAWTSDPWTGAAGSRGTTVLFRGVDSLTGCEISGRAVLVLRDANGGTLLSAETPVSTVGVEAGTLLEIGISWSNWCGDAPAGPISLALTLPGDSSEVPLVPPTDAPGPGSGIPVPPCNGVGQPSVLNATDFQPSDRTPPEG